MIPKLKRSSRSREYDIYTEEQRRQVVKAWLFTDMTHRQIDNKILKLESIDSRGWQSMGILHYLGLTKEFHGLFKDMSVKEAAKEIESTENPEYRDILQILNTL